MPNYLRCLDCSWYNYDFFDHKYVSGSFCGLHGCVSVIPGSKQLNLNNHGSCGFLLRSNPVQLSLFL